jgi:PAS domain S-box-containing protein
MAVDSKIENAQQLPHVTNVEFETLFNYATVGILISDSNGVVVNFNQYAEQLFGYQKEEIIGSPVELLIPHGKRVAHVAHRTKFNEHPANRMMAASNILFAKRKDDSVFPVEISLSHFTNDGQQFVIAFIIDSTVRKQNEDLLKEQKNQVQQFAEQTKSLNAELEKKIEDRTKMLKETLEALENTQQETTKALNFQKAILNHAGACIIATDVHGVVQLFNSTAEEYLGYSKSEVIDGVNVIRFHLASEIQANAAAFSKELGKIVTPDFNVLSAKSIDDLPNEHEWTYVRKDGTTFTVSLNVTTLRDAQNTISGFLGVAVDISEIKNYQNSLQVALEKEKQLGDLKSRFVTMASHEFRTPLSTILSSVSLIDKYTSVEDVDKREKHVKRIKSAVGNMKDILEDFLSLGKMEEGKIQLNPELLAPAELRDELEAVIQEMQRLTKPSQQITHTFTVTEDCNIDRKMLRHIMTNLISNAIKFSPEGSSVDVSCEHRKNELIFTIQDTGIGISEADQKHLFERFFRAENVSNIQGTGLGLHIISRYLDLVDGRIELMSELNKGTTFIVHIPQKVVE